MTALKSNLFIWSDKNQEGFPMYPYIRLVNDKCYGLDLGCGPCRNWLGHPVRGMRVVQSEPQGHSMAAGGNRRGLADPDSYRGAQGADHQ